MMQDSSQKTKAILAALFVTVLWATSWVLIKIGLKDIPPILFVGMRYCLAFICLIPLFIRQTRNKNAQPLTKSLVFRLLVLGLLLYAVTQGASYIGLSRLPAITTSLILSFISIFTALLGIVFLREKPAAIQWLGLGLSIAGAYTYFSINDIYTNDWIGILIVFGGVLAAAFAAVLGRDINQNSGLHPIQITTISMGSGGILLLVTGLLFEQMPALSWQSILIILWLAVVNTAFAFTLWNWTMKFISAVESTVINGAMQVEIPILAVIFLGEKLNLQQLIGLILTVFGIFIVQTGKTCRWGKKIKPQPQ
ncbi:MAG: DMT family transporter [Anaerolineaceae bacterium]|nr:DMT family transporter [Anaerolineaceae bacterium]